LPEQGQKAAACQAQSESFFLNKRPPPRPEAWGKKRTRKTSLLFTDEPLLFVSGMLLHIPVVEIRAFLVLPQIQKGKKKAAEMEECAGDGGCCFRGRFSTEICAACLLPQPTLEPARGCFQSLKNSFFQIECCFLCLVGKRVSS
jgi:hypothetical protein